MKESSFEFNPEAAAGRAELVGHLKINPRSPESKELLRAWAIIGEKLVSSGAMDIFAWNREEAQIYIEAEQVDAAVYVLKCALAEAIQQENEEEVDEFRKLLFECGADPNDLSEIYGE